MSLAPNEPHEIGCSLFKLKHYLRACTTSGKKYGYCMQNNQWKIIGDQLPTKSPVKLPNSIYMQILQLYCSLQITILLFKKNWNHAPWVNRSGSNPIHKHRKQHEAVMDYCHAVTIHAPNIATAEHNINQVLTMEAKEASLNVQAVFEHLLVEVDWPMRLSVSSTMSVYLAPANHVKSL